MGCGLASQSDWIELERVYRADEFNIRSGDERIFLDHAAMRFYKSAKVQISGDAKLGDRPDVHLNGVLSGLDLAEVLPADWVKKFKGIVDGKFKIKTRNASRAMIHDAHTSTSPKATPRIGSIATNPVK